MTGTANVVLAGWFAMAEIRGLRSRWVGPCPPTRPASAMLGAVLGWAEWVCHMAASVSHGCPRAIRQEADCQSTLGELARSFWCALCGSPVQQKAERAVSTPRHGRADLNHRVREGQAR
jgi:hypothetical protein